MITYVVISFNADIYGGLSSVLFVRYEHLFVEKLFNLILAFQQAFGSWLGEAIVLWRALTSDLRWSNVKMRLRLSVGALCDYIYVYYLFNAKSLLCKCKTTFTLRF